MFDVRSLGEVLNGVEALDPEETLFLEEGAAISPETKVVVAHFDDLEEDEETVTVDGVRYQAKLQVSSVQDVVENLKAQGAEPDEAARFRALQFYLDHDAFIDLAGGEE